MLLGTGWAIEPVSSPATKVRNELDWLVFGGMIAGSALS